MKNKNMNIWRVCFIVAVIVIILMLIYIVIQNGKVKTLMNSGPAQNIIYGNQDYSGIMLEEELNINGEIENLEGVRWDRARISQNGGTVDVSITINNEKEEKIEARHLKIELLNEAKEVIAEGDAELKELESNHGYEMLDIQVGMPIPQVVHAIKITAEPNSET